jgi:hypothetical protein
MRLWVKEAQVRIGLRLGSQHQAQPSANWVLDLVGPGGESFRGLAHVATCCELVALSHAGFSHQSSRLRGPALATFSLNLPNPEATALFLS